ncbi:MAG: hypothetical protein LYZ66_01810, partial [Nitrososphaerales archaeon]|nr:hypothetical protein [Nitrososphaerales archaeon]
MAKILYCVSPIGLGHATRAVAVGQELAKKGHELVFATGGYAAEFLEGEGFRVEDAIVEPVPKVRGGEMKNAARWYFDYWRGYHRSRTALSRLLDLHRPGLVVGDEEFACLSLALERGLRHAMISDELELGFARGWLARRLEKRVGRWYKELQRRVSLIIIPEEGEDSGNIRHVGPVVRARTKTRAQVFDELALSGSNKLVLVSMSGSDVGDELLHRAIDAFQEAKIPLAQLLVSGNRGPRVSGDCIRDLGMVRDNQNLVAASDLVVTNGG